MAIGRIVIQVVQEGAESVAEAADGAASSFDKAGKAAFNFNEILKSGKNVLELAKKGYEAINKGLDEYVKVNQSMAAVTKLGTERMDQLRAASKGTISDFDLATKATQKFGQNVKATTKEWDEFKKTLADDAPTDRNVANAMRMRSAWKNSIDGMKKDMAGWMNSLVTSWNLVSDHLDNSDNWQTFKRYAFGSGGPGIGLQAAAMAATSRVSAQAAQYRAAKNDQEQALALQQIVAENGRAATTAGIIGQGNAWIATGNANYEKATAKGSGGSPGIVEQGLGSITAYRDPNRYYGSTDMPSYLQSGVVGGIGGDTFGGPVDSMTRVNRYGGGSYFAANDNRTAGIDAYSAGLRADTPEEAKRAAQIGALNEQFAAFGQQAVAGLAESVTAGITAVLDGTDSMIGAFGKILAARAKMIRNEALLEAAKHGAYALGNLAIGDLKSAGLHGVAAAKFLGVAALAQGASMVGGAMSGGGGGSSAYGAAGGGPSPGGSFAPAPAQNGNRPVVNNYYISGVVGDERSVVIALDKARKQAVEEGDIDEEDERPTRRRA